MNVRNGEEFYSAALTLGIVTREELVFRHRNFTVKPVPDDSKKRKKSKQV